MPRGLLIGGGVVVVIIVAAVILLVSSLDSLIEAAVEKIGSQVTGVTVELDEAEVSTTSGQGALRGLTVGNPKGFKTPSAMRLGEVSLSLDLGSIQSDTVLIKEIVVAAPEITYELSSDGSNIDAIRRNVEANTAGGGTSQSSGDEGGKKMVIENLYVRGAKVQVSATVLGGQTVGATLPEIHLTDIGKDEGGTDAGQIIDEVLAAVGGALGKTVGSPDLGGAVDKLKDAAAGAGEQATEKLEGVTEGAGKALEDAGKEAEGALKKLMGR